ncbi:hypothetical protein LGL55_06915 [Clostridium tagluense]|uniref:hypothetical protein n=1 Tax=Clostridium tagluense TaxID=360422 RepID=UPI001CF10B5A|nr:hypothetical protein [Clostridium tagluense]MCB2310942.1 hypothetical protein [Clostridium tagluense]MCB2320560.1 hypothetical protein [Clostridium tagluense]MCB2335159.1 hypothetical protein [Clostridium tagluense]MCB2363950.1 hypothetical protein [Clostridium tagluense]
MVNIEQVVCIVVSVVIILEGINLLTNTSKLLVKASMKLRAFCNSNTRGALARNYGKTSKIIAIQDIICGTLLLIFSININNTELIRGSTGSFILLVISVLNLFILGVVVKCIK